MSFILDALKKSENARQRQAGPALFEVRVAPPRRGLPIWAIVIGILLLINGTVLAWMLLRRPAARPGPVVPATVRAAPSPAAATPPGSIEPSVLTPVSVAPASPPGPGGVSVNPTTPSSVPASRAPAEPAASPPAPPAAGDLAPAVQPPPAATQAATSALPLYAQISTSPGTQLPPLHMDLHVYDPDPSKRFVMINMHKLHQGDSLTDGVTVVQIRPDGVVLSYQGQKFLLPR